MKEFHVIRITYSGNKPREWQLLESFDDPDLAADYCNHKAREAVERNSKDMRYAGANFHHAEVWPDYPYSFIVCVWKSSDETGFVTHEAYVIERTPGYEFKLMQDD